MINHRSVCLLALLSTAVHCAPGSTGESSDDTRDVEASVVTASGSVFGTDGDGLNVRAEPSTSAAIVGHLAEGQSVGISCQVSGSSVEGNTLWDYLPDHGGYVSDRYLDTGHAAEIPGVPTCGNDPGPEEGGDCDGLDYIGECQGEVLVWCENDALRTKDCGSAGQSCGYQNDSIGYNCLGGGGGGGGLLTVTEIVGGGYDVTQPYGYSGTGINYSYCNAYGVSGFDTHCGVDIGIPSGTPLYIPGDATVTIAGWSGYFTDEYGGAGELKIVFGDGTEVILGHMSEIWVGVGDSVSGGQPAGLSGSSNGPHLHLEVRVPGGGGLVTVDPMTFFGW